MDQFKTQNKLINFASVTAAAAFLIVIAIAVLVLWPMYQGLEIVRSDIERERTEVQVKKEYVLKLDEIKAQLDDRQAEVSRIQTALPASPAVPSLFNYLQRTSSEYGLVLTEISPFAVSSSKTFTDLKETAFSIKVSGPYPSLKNFISTLEKSARLIEVENMTLSPTQDESFNFNLSLKVFSY